MERVQTLLISLASAVVTTCLTVIIVAACTTSSYDKRRDALPEEQQGVLDDFRAELEIGRNMAGRLLQFYGTQTDEGLLNYVNEVGSYVAQFSEHPNRRYMFEILDEESVNAFACPGGYILVTMGAIRNAVDEAELAGVLGHEIAHVGKKHMFDKLKGMSDDEMEKAAEVAKKKMELPKTVLVRERPRGDESKIGQIMAKYLAGGAAGLNIIKAAGAGMGVILDQGLGADKEYEADAEGVKYASQAGYEPDALADFLCRIEMKRGGKRSKCNLAALAKTVSKKKKQTILDRTHPPVHERVKNITTVLKEIDAGEIIGARGVKRFQRFKRRLPPVGS